MPLPAFVGAASTSNIIAVSGILMGAGFGIGTLPSDAVTIGNISLSLAPQAEIFVGDRIVFTTQIDVSYGEISSDGTGGKIKVELIEQGTGVLAIEERRARSPKETFDVRCEGRTISHGTKLYYVKVTATGEEDLSYCPSGDSVVTRVRQSDTVSLEAKKPIVITTTLLTPSVSHGQQARVIMKASNFSETNAQISTKLDSYYYTAGFLRGEETERRIIDLFITHPDDDHEGEKTWYIEPVEFTCHLMFIETPEGLKPYDQIAPDPKITYDPIPVTCNGGARRIGYVPNHWDGRRVGEGEYGYACATVDGNDQPLACSAVFRDFYGNSIIATQSNNGLSFQGALTGEVGTITFTPENSFYKPYSFRVLLDDAFIKELPEKFIFYPSPLPPIRGLVFIKKERLPVQGCSVELKTISGEMINSTITNSQGAFEVYPVAKRVGAGSEFELTVKLPWDITYEWKTQIMSRKITREEISSEHFSVVFDAEVQIPEDWVKIGGRVVARDSRTKKPVPIPGIKIGISDELGDMQDNVVTGDKGEYSLDVKSGRYLIEVANAVELGFNFVSPRSFSARASKSDADLWLSLARPSVNYESPEVIKVKPGEQNLPDKLVILRNGEIIKEYKAKEGSFYITLKDLEITEGLEMAFMQNELVGPTNQLIF